jgi:hypothetical protein
MGGSISLQSNLFGADKVRDLAVEVLSKGMTMMRFRAFMLMMGMVFIVAGPAPGQDEEASTQPVSATGTSTGTADSPTIKPRKVRIGAWNIEWLGQPDKRYGKAQGNTQKAADLADYILASRVEALALEEICPTNLSDPQRYDPEVDGPLDNEILRAALEIVSKKSKGEWMFRLFPSSGTTRSTNQLTGIAWNSAKLSVLGDSWPAIEYDKSKRQSWFRPPWATAFSTGDGMTDLVIIPIHMKAFDNEAAIQQRTREAGELVEALAESDGDPDILIIGDSNCHSGEEQALKVYAAAGFIDLNRRNLPTHIGGPPLDRVFTPKDQPEFAKRFFQVFGKPYTARRRLGPNDFHARYSDHYMVITTVQAGEDDD